MSTETFTQTVTYVMPDTLLAIRKPCVLVLEDDEELAQNLQELLSGEGYLVTHARSGAEGVKALLRREFHVILCDMVMPNFPGDMFYLAVQRSRPEMCQRFIFMTGHRTDRRIDQFIREVGGVMLWKPFASHELLEAIRGVVKKVEALYAKPI